MKNGYEEETFYSNKSFARIIRERSLGVDYDISRLAGSPIFLLRPFLESRHFWYRFTPNEQPSFNQGLVLLFNGGVHHFYKGGNDFRGKCFCSIHPRIWDIQGTFDVLSDSFRKIGDRISGLVTTLS